VRSWPAASNPNLENQVIFGKGFLPLALDKSISNCRTVVLVLIQSGYFISPVPTTSVERSPIRHLGRHPMGETSNFSTWMEGVQAGMTTRNIEPDQWRNREVWLLVSGRRRQLLK